MKDRWRIFAKTATAGLMAALAAGGVTYAAVAALGREPLTPTVIVSVIVLAKVAMSHRSGRRE